MQAGLRGGSFSEDRPLGWDPVAAGNRAGDGMARFASEEKAADTQAGPAGRLPPFRENILDAGTCARKYAHHKNSFYDFYNAAQGGVPGVPREMITLR